MTAPARILRPVRARLAEALAVVTDRRAGWWCASLEGHGGTSTSGLRYSDGHGACFYLAGCREPPDRPGNTAHCVGDVTIADPAELWEALATRGVIPLDWVGDPRRGFVGPCEVCEGRGWVGEYGGQFDCGACVAHSGDVLLPHPPTLAACVALAADVPGVLRAEALARETAGGSDLRVVWRVGEPSSGWSVDFTQIELGLFPTEAIATTRGLPAGLVLTRGAEERLAPSRRDALQRDLRATGEYWPDDMPHMLWRAVRGGRRRYGKICLKVQEADTLRMLSAAVGGWYVWQDGPASQSTGPRRG